MKIKKISDPEKIKTIVKKDNLKIIMLLTNNQLSIDEVSNILDKSKYIVRRRVKELENHGLIIRCGKKKRKYNDIQLYTRDESFFILSIPCLNETEIKIDNIDTDEEKFIQQIIKLFKYIEINKGND